MKPIDHRLRKSLGVLLAIIIVIGWDRQVPPALAAVTLASFTAIGEDEVVWIEWETATELDNSGFYVWRSQTEEGAYNRISPLIPSEGDPLTGAFYEYEDNDVDNGTRYWYKLETIDLGQASEFFGPVSAIPAEPTPTGTITLTNVATHTPTPTAPPTNPPPTSTSATPYPAPGATATFPAAPTLAPTQPLPTLPAPVLPSPTTITTPTPPTTSTTTMPGNVVPLLQITLIFPTEGIVIPARTTPTPTPLPVVASPPVSWSPWGGVMLIGFLVLIWVMLGSWFYLSFPPP